MNEETPADPLYTSAERLELEHARAAFAGSVRRRLALWAARWTVGFAAIGIAVYLWPSLAWLFRAGAVLAAVSLVVTLVVHRVTLRRLATGERRLDELEQIAVEAEREMLEQKAD